MDGKQSDDQKVKDYGVELAVKMISDLRTSGLIDGIHLSTLNLERSSRLILEQLGLAPSKKPELKVN